MEGILPVVKSYRDLQISVHFPIPMVLEALAAPVALEALAAPASLVALAAPAALALAAPVAHVEKFVHSIFIGFSIGLKIYYCCQWGHHI